MAELNDAAPVVNPVADDSALVTKGELRDEMAKMRAEMNAKMDVMNAKIDDLITQFKSQKTGVELGAPIIPVGNVVVENNSAFAHASKALLRHKGRKVMIITRFRNSKKYM